MVDVRGIYRPKIQRLVTPLRLQRRRHLRALKIRRFEHQKEQKAEYEYVSSSFSSLRSLCWAFSVPLSQNVSQKRRRRLLRSKHHIRSVSLLARINTALQGSCLTFRAA